MARARHGSLRDQPPTRCLAAAVARVGATAEAARRAGHVGAARLQRRPFGGCPRSVRGPRRVGLPGCAAAAHVVLPRRPRLAAERVRRAAIGVHARSSGAALARP